MHTVIKLNLNSTLCNLKVSLSRSPNWCAPIVVAPKKNSDNIRLCVDYSKLNKFVKRELYSSCTPSDAMADISSQNSAFFTVFDALKGYHQCPLDQESQLLTCFMTPFGRFKFLRAPFGICSISEHYNRRLDEAFQGLKNYRRIVMTSLFLTTKRPTIWHMFVNF